MALDLTRSTLAEFRKANTHRGETVEFAVVGGDFNLDNISPGDAKYQRHALFKDYLDLASDGPGKDKPWSVGTECRQPRLQDEGMHDPERYRK